MLRRVVWWKFTDVSEVVTASITYEKQVHLYQIKLYNFPEDSHLH
jgi:hypothetical protein